MADDTTTLTVAPRSVEGSRSTRRLRRTGLVPGVVYGGESEPIAFQVEARTLRQALAHGGAVITLTVEGEGETPVVLKDQQRHPVTGDTMHVDLLRVDLRQKIGAVVVVELTGGDDAPGVKAGGVLEQVTRELNIEALPN
jgi:large subunit ribosomal protein L25